MEAHGHERIEKEVADFLEELIKKRFPEKYALIYGANADNAKSALYLGNWLTDISQLFAPDSIFEFRVNMSDKFQSYNSKVKTFVSTIQKPVLDGVHMLEAMNNAIINLLAYSEKEIKDIQKKLKKTASKTNNTIYKTPTEAQKNKAAKNIIAVSKGVIKTDADAKRILDTITHQTTMLFRSSANQFSSPEEYVENAFDKLLSAISVSESVIDWFKRTNFDASDKDEIWYLTASVIRFLGYNKFCKKGDMDFKQFEYIVNNFLDNKPPKDKPNEVEKLDHDFRFKLNGYFPSDHLDRAFDSNALDQYYAKDKFDKRKNFIDTKLNEKDKIYKYLEAYIQVTGSKLNQLNINFVLDFIYKNKAIETKNINLFFSQLGQALHAVEDFYAHSNYIELCVYNLDTITKNESGFYSRQEFLDILEHYERDRYDRALQPPICAVTPTAKGLEGNIVTGYYAEGDMDTSMYHLLFGSLDKKINEIDYGEYILGLSQKLRKDKASNYPGMQIFDAKGVSAITIIIQAMQDFVDVIELVAKAKTTEEKKDDNKRRVDEFYNKFVKAKEFNLEIFDFILGFTDKSFNKELNPQEKELAVDIIKAIFAIVIAIEIAKLAYEKIIEIKESYKDLETILKLILDILKKL
jgi:hypothetical protein